MGSQWILGRWSVDSVVRLSKLPRHDVRARKGNGN